MSGSEFMRDFATLAASRAIDGRAAASGAQRGWGGAAVISEPYDSINIAQNLPSPIMREEPEVVAALASDDADVCGEVFSFCVCTLSPAWR